MSLFDDIAPDRSERADMKVGIEIEWPEADGDPLKNEGQDSSGLRRQIDRWPLRGRTTNDPSVGLEIVCEPPLEPDDAPEWYAESINYVEEEHNGTFAPTGMIHGNTAGLHTHISPISRDKARTLHEWSAEPWLQCFVCSSVVEKEAPYYRVFRDNYCRLEPDVTSGDRYAAVNERSRSKGHYEWRLPEPMTVENLRHMMRFLKLFKYDPEKAKEYALEILEKEDNITSIKRADAIGRSLNFGDRGEVTRNPHDGSNDFWSGVVDDESHPFIYRVDIPDEGSFYAFESRRDTDFHVNGVRFDRQTVLRADTLTRVPDSSNLYEEVTDTLENRNGPRPKEATKYLKDVMKKKKK